MDSPDTVGKASLGGRAPYVSIYLQLRNGIVTNAMFQTYGCGVSIACCSALTEMITGIPLSECHLLSPASLIETLNGIPDEKLFCADMAIEALRDGLSRLELLQTRHA